MTPMRYQNTNHSYHPPKHTLLPRVLTPNARRDRVYEYILAYCAAHGGNPPTIREIMDAVEISSSSVVGYYIKQLIEMGLLAIVDRKLCVCGATWTPPEP